MYFHQQKAISSPTSWISFLVSFAIHLTLGIALAVMLVGGGQGAKVIEISGSIDDSSTNEAMELLELEHPEEPVEPLDNPEVRLAMDSSASIDFDTLDATSTDSATYARLASQVDSLSETPKPGKGEQKATFFGAEAYGNRFVFVIDSSRSMAGQRWAALCYELEQAIRSLGTEQEFFIISFDSEAHPMFGSAPPKGKFLNPDLKSIRRVKNWLRSVELGRNTYPSSSMMMALSLRPDAIFLLSDGEIRDSTVTDLQRVNGFISDSPGQAKSIPIHTVLLHSQFGFQTLEQIAEDNHGTFTPVALGISN